MKNIKIENASMCIRVEVDFALLNNNLTFTAGYQCFLYKKDNNELEVEIDFTDMECIKFMDIGIEEGYRPYSIWKKNMLDIGLDIEKITNDNCFNTEVCNEIKQYIIGRYGNNNLNK